MEMKAFTKKITEGIKKYRYAVLVLVIGLILMAIPGWGKNSEQTKTEIKSEAVSEPSLEAKLLSVLSQVEGAGEVRVILTVAAGEKTVYQTDDDFNSDADSDTTSIDTVIVADAARNQLGLVQQIIPAVYQGAVIVCQGADNPSVKLALVDAVSKLTGLGANCISVLKMK